MAKLAARLEHVHIFRKGKLTYVYYRKGACKVRIRRSPEDFKGIRAEVERIERELSEARLNPASTHREGSLGWLITEYRKSDWWKALRASTRVSYERAFVVLEELKKKDLSFLDRSKILRLRDQAWMPERGRWLANMTVTVLGIVLKFGQDKGHLKTNPLAENVRKIRAPKVKGAAPANRPWTEEERRIVLAEAEPHVRLALALMMCTGLRKSDAFEVGFNDIRDGDISVITNKRNAPVSLPIHPVLATAISARPGEKVGRLVIRRDGKPYTADGFDTVWHRYRKTLLDRGAISPGLTLHGLRHTLGTLLKEAGMDDGDIADVLGQASVSMARLYSRHARLSQDTREKIVALKIQK